MSNIDLNRICSDSESACFWKIMDDTSILTEKCFCLSDCSHTVYPHSDAMFPLDDKKCNIGTYQEFIGFKGAYFNENGNYLGEEVDWHTKLSRNALEASPTTLAFCKKLILLTGKKYCLGSTHQFFETSSKHYLFFTSVEC